MDFNIGDKVICLTDHSSTNGIYLIKGNQYTIHNIMKCGCGVINLDVGLGHIVGFRSKCVVCSSVYNNDVWWLNSKRFTKADNDKETSVDVSEFMSIFTTQKELA